MKTQKGVAIAVGCAAGACAAWAVLKRQRSARKALAAGKNIVILGSGFAGAYAAQRLGELLPSDGDATITLIDEHNYLLFTPMLPEVAGGELDPLDIVRSPRLLSRRVRFLQAQVKALDIETREVTVDVAGSERKLHADHLVIALGSVDNFHDVPGVEQRALTMKTLEDAGNIRNRAIAMLERANAEEDPAVRRRLLTFVVAGGGFTGVETAASLNDFLRDTARQYPEIQAGEPAAYLINPGERLLPELEPDLAEYAQHKLEERGVHVLLNSKLTKAEDHYIELEGGRQIEAETLIWAAGVKPNPAVEHLDVQRGKHGGIVVDEHLAVPGEDGVWAVGDCAEVPKPSGGNYAPTAQNATREGQRAAENIVARLRGEPLRPFQHRPIGEMALVGKRAGVASVYGVRFSGLPAWALWRMVYLSKMPGASQRTRILLDWMLDFVFGRNTAAVPSPLHSADYRGESTSFSSVAASTAAREKGNG